MHISRLKTACDIPYCYQNNNKSLASEGDDATSRADARWGSLELATRILDLCTTPCVCKLITGCCTCFGSMATFRSNGFLRSFVKPCEDFGHSVACYPLGDSLSLESKSRSVSHITVSFVLSRRMASCRANPSRGLFVDRP